MSKKKLLVQLDSDKHASVFDAVVATDAGVEQLLQYANVQAEDVQGLVHGVMFTRGPEDLKYSAVFIGGSNVGVGEQMLKQVQASFFGPLKVSVMLDANGANTTAAAAVLAAERHLKLEGVQCLVLGATGPVGQRVVRLLAGAGAKVHVASRNADRAREVCDAIRQHHAGAQLTPLQAKAPEELTGSLEQAEVVISAGAAGVVLLPSSIRSQAKKLKVAIDLNAVPPLGIEGLNAMDKAKERDGVICYGAIGVGGTKMKIHKAAVQQLFESNDRVLDAEQIFQIGRELDRKG